MQIKMILAAFLVAFSAHSGSDSSAESRAHAEKKTHRALTSAQRIFIDESTGEARAPTREERLELRRQNDAVAATKSAEAPKTVRFSDGSVGVFIRKPKNQIQAHVSTDGRVVTHCDDAHSKKVQP